MDSASTCQLLAIAGLGPMFRWEKSLKPLRDVALKPPPEFDSRAASAPLPRERRRWRAGGRPPRGASSWSAPLSTALRPPVAVAVFPACRPVTRKGRIAHKAPDPGRPGSVGFSALDLENPTNLRPVAILGCAERHDSGDDTRNRGLLRKPPHSREHLGPPGIAVPFRPTVPPTDHCLLPGSPHTPVRRPLGEASCASRSKALRTTWFSVRIVSYGWPPVLLAEWRATDSVTTPFAR